MTTTATASRQLVVFSLGAEEYALPIEDVHEIIRYAPPRRVASRDRSVCGVISLRGKILPVFELAARLGLPPTDHAEGGAKIVIVETEDAMAGVVVDDVEEVLTVEEEQLDTSPAGSGVVGDCIEAIAKVDDRLVCLLSAERIVATETAVLRADAPASPVATPVADAVAA